MFALYFVIYKGNGRREMNFFQLGALTKVDYHLCKSSGDVVVNGFSVNIVKGSRDFFFFLGFPTGNTYSGLGLNVLTYLCPSTEYFLGLTIISYFF